LRTFIFATICVILVSPGFGQANVPLSFEAASIKPASPSAPAFGCRGGPGTSDPVTWKCESVPLNFLITYGYGFAPYQFPRHHSCCEDRFDVSARVPPDATKDQFRRMVQSLLTRRFGFAFHYDLKETAAYELTVADKGLKMKKSAPAAASVDQDPFDTPEYTVGKDGYPAFPPGVAGYAGMNNRHRWTGFSLSMPEIARTLSFYLGGPVIDATGLSGRFDIDLKWATDVALALELAGRREEAAEVPDLGTPGPPLIRAVQDQLGLKLTSTKGPGDIVVIDHIERVPTDN
jgi:uncharacterized protein (TIGR03435 family)